MLNLKSSKQQKHLMGEPTSKACYRCIPMNPAASMAGSHMIEGKGGR